MDSVKNIDLENILAVLGYRGEGVGSYEWYQAYNKLIDILDAVGTLTNCNVDKMIAILDNIDNSDF